MNWDRLWFMVCLGVVDYERHDFVMKIVDFKVKFDFE